MLPLVFLPVFLTEWHGREHRVIGHVSAEDISLVEEVEHIKIEEAHVEEKILEKELKKEGDFEDLENLREHEKEKPQD